MPGRLQSDIKQSKPFDRIEEEAYLNVLRTADALAGEANAFLKEYGLSQTQYNALRILRGAGGQGLPCGEIGARMITRDPDITRLLDRLDKQGLVERARDTADRRVVTVRITAAGMERIAPIDARLEDWLRRLLGHFTNVELRALIELLERARERAGQLP
jgi:MarR family transcriptional regulator, organic hydroperoxide resistance regulator